MDSRRAGSRSHGVGTGRGAPKPKSRSLGSSATRIAITELSTWEIVVAVHAVHAGD